MATATQQLTILHRGGTPRKPPCDCGQPGLEWVATAQGPQYVKPQARGPARNAEGWGQWRIVPFGTDDLSGKVHPVIPCHGKSAYAQGKYAPPPSYGEPVPDIAIEEPPAIPDMTGIADAIEAAIPPAPIMQPYDDSAILKRLGDLEDAVGSASPIITDMLGKLDAVNTNINVELKAMKDEIAARDKARPIAIMNVATAQPVSIGRMHQMYLNFLTAVIAVGDSGVVTGVGEAGSWKSSASQHILAGLQAHLNKPNLEMEAETFHPDSAAADVLGFISPLDGKYVESKFRRAFEHGKLMVADEFTRGPNEAIASVNGMTAIRYGESTGFPDKLVTRHPHNYVIAWANTFGISHDSEYIGAQQLDPATLSRQVFIPWNTDWDALADSLGLKSPGNDANIYSDPGAPREHGDDVVQEWLKIVHAVRCEVQRIPIRAVISSRAGINGYKLLRAGMDEKLVRFATMWALMSTDDANQVRSNLGLTY